jgi:hypothetical protein
VKLGEWNGQAKRISKPLSEIKLGGEIDSFAVVVQGGKPDAPGSIYGAAFTLAQSAASN